MKQAALLVEKLQEKITTFAKSYSTKTLSDNAGAFGETFASEVVQKQTAKQLHDLRDTYIQQAKQLLTTQEALLNLFRGTADAQVKSQQAQIKALLDEVIKQVQTITSLGKELTATEKNFFDQFHAWMQKTMRGSKQYQKSIPDLQHNYLQASHKVNDQRDHVQQARLAELQSWGT